MCSWAVLGLLMAAIKLESKIAPTPMSRKLVTIAISAFYTRVRSQFSNETNQLTLNLYFASFSDMTFFIPYNDKKIV